MSRQHPDRFVRNHIFKRVWPGVINYVSGVTVSENFGAVKESSASVSAVTDKGVEQTNKEAI
jgi:hypothetical protein